MATAEYLIEKFRMNEGDGVLGWRKKCVCMLQCGSLSGLTAQHKINLAQSGEVAQSVKRKTYI